MKAYLRISGAVLMGAILVVGALLLPKDTPADAGAGVVVTKAPSREYIDTDTNGDGKPDWEELLSARIIDTIELPASTTWSATSGYEKPITLTGKFSESFFTDYMNGKTGGTDIVDKTEFVKRALAAIESSAQSRTYASGDLRVVPNDDEAIREYGNLTATVMLNLPQTGENEMAIFSESIQTNNPDLLKKLALIKESYRTLVAQSHEVAVPAAYVPIHLKLINAYEVLRFDTEAMEQGFTDPLFALARVKEHYTDTSGLFEIIKDLQNQLLADGVVYEEGEPGAYLFVFKL